LENALLPEKKPELNIVPVPPGSRPTLLQRLREIQREVQVEITGTFSIGQNTRRPALSIGDVDKALGPKFAEHGVVSDYTFSGQPILVESSQGKLWMVSLLITLRNVDDEKDTIQATVYDIGSNISAAVSFALKRYYRALFKLVEDDDQTPEVTRVVTPAGIVEKSEPAPSIPVASSWTTDQERLLTQLRESLPKGESPFSWSMIQKQPYETALKILTKKHENQCWDTEAKQTECVQHHLAVS
jgi:hypothetical protein